MSKTGKPKWRAGNAEAEARADALRSRFKKISEQALPFKNRTNFLRTAALLIGLASIGFVAAGVYDLQ